MMRDRDDTHARGAAVLANEAREAVMHLMRNATIHLDEATGAHSYTFELPIESMDVLRDLHIVLTGADARELDDEAVCQLIIEHFVARVRKALGFPFVPRPR